jgi:hypothetical protein
LEDFNRQALKWRDQVAHLRPWPADDSRIVADAFSEERPRLLSLPVNAFDTDLVKPIRSDKTIYVRFDLNDYSILPDAAGRQLTLTANPEWVRLLDGAREIARHRRSYDRHARIDDPAHSAALLEQKRKALGATATGRMEQLVPSIENFLDTAFARGESAASQTRQLLDLLEDYGAPELEAALREAIERQTSRAASVAFILSRRRRSGSNKFLPVNLSRHPHLADLSVPTHQLEIYDDLTDDEQ